MAVLELLALRAPRVVSIEEMIQIAWSGTIVSDNTVYRAITLLRKALGDSARDSQYIESIARKGYRLKPEVIFAEASVREDPPSPTGTGRLSVSIEISEGSEPDRMIGTAISRYLSWSSDVFRLHLWPAATLKVDYRLLLTFSDDAEGRCLVWNLLGGESNDLIFASNLKVSIPVEDFRRSAIAETISDEVYEQIRRHKLLQLVESQLPDSQMSYWELILSSDDFRGTDVENLKRRESRLLAGIDRYPELAPAYAAYADYLSWRVLNFTLDDPRSTSSEAKQMAYRAIDLDRDSPYALSRAGAVFARLGDYDRGVEYCQRAMQLAPSIASREALSRAYCFAGRPEDAISLLKEIEQTLPAGHAFNYTKIVVPLVQSGQFHEALNYSFRTVSSHPGDYYPWAMHSNVLAQLGQIDEAGDAWKEATRLAPHLTFDSVISGTSKTYGRNEAQVGHLTQGLVQLREYLDQE